MSVHKMKNNKLMKVGITILFAILMACCLEKTVYGVLIESINGKHTWDVDVNDTDYNYANVVQEFYEFSDNDIISQKLNDGVSELNPGYKIGKTGTVTFANPDCPTKEDIENVKKTFNWGSTLGNVDFKTFKDYFIQSACIHPEKKLNTYLDDTSYVQKILFISEDYITLYDKFNKNGIVKCVEEDDKVYFKIFLQETYESQNDVDRAAHVKDHLRDKTFHDYVSRYFKYWGVETKSIDFYEGTKCLTSKDEENSYYGMYVYVGTGGERSQGRILFRAVRTEAKKSIELPIKKLGFNGTGLGQSFLTIWDDDEGKTTIDKLISLNNYNCYRIGKRQ